MLDSLGSKAMLRKNGEHLQCEEAHKAVVLNMGGDDERLPPLREMGARKNAFDHHHNWHLMGGPSQPTTYDALDNPTHQKIILFQV